MVVHLIIVGYLKEDFHFTAYSTLSYIKIGAKRPAKNSPITFNGARVLNLPGTHNLWNDADESSTAIDSHQSPSVSKEKHTERPTISDKTPTKLPRKSSSHHTSCATSTPKLGNSSSVRPEDSSSSSDRRLKKRRTRSVCSDRSSRTTKSSSHSDRKKSRHRGNLENESIERITTSVSKMVSEIVDNETKRRTMLRRKLNTSGGDDSDADVVILPDDDDVILIDD